MQLAGLEGGGEGRERALMSQTPWCRNWSDVIKGTDSQLEGERALEPSHAASPVFGGPVLRTSPWLRDVI